MTIDRGPGSAGPSKAGRGQRGEADQQDPDAHPAAPEWPDAQKLAQDWIILWQSELAAIAVDPEIRESWQTIMTLWAGTISSVLRGLSTTDRHDSARGRPWTADAPRAPTAATTPDARDAEIERLARHVVALERRLADLERGDSSPVYPEGRP